MGPDRAFPAVLEGELVFRDEAAPQGGHPLDHDDEVMAAIVQVVDVALAEVAPVQDEAYIPVTVGLGFLQHELQLRDIDDAAGILLIEQGLAVGLVIGDGIVEDGKPPFLLCMTVFYNGKVPGLAVLVRGVIGDVDSFPVVPLAVPPIEE